MNKPILYIGNILFALGRNWTNCFISGSVMISSYIFSIFNGCSLTNWLFEC